MKSRNSILFLFACTFALAACTGKGTIDAYRPGHAAQSVASVVQPAAMPAPATNPDNATAQAVELVDAMSLSDDELFLVVVLGGVGAFLLFAWYVGFKMPLPGRIAAQGDE